MTDFTTPTTTYHHRIRDAGLPFVLMGMLRDAGTVLAGCGKAFTAVQAAYGRALELAYSAPYTRPSQKRPIADEQDLEGRDPNW